jgi:hypothetical protein
MTTMGTVVRTRSRGTYTTILCSVRQHPCISFETNPNSLYPSQSPLQSNQIAQTSDPEIRQADLLFRGMTVDEHDIGFYKVSLNFLPYKLGLSFNNIGLLKHFALKSLTH